jgi:hypothetical protein
MNFLVGDRLTREMQRLVSEPDLKIAIAYWGADAFKRLKELDPKRNDQQIVCCLSGGKSAPEVIAQFGGKARQKDKLHAKVIWTPSGAIVGSANASSNGLPDEEEQVDGLIEAGVYVDDAADLANIQSWFEDLYKDAQAITDADLEAAKDSQDKRNAALKAGKVPELVDISLSKLKQLKIAALVYSGEMTDEDDRKVKKLDAQWLKSDNVDWYGDTRTHASQYPYGYETITFTTNRTRRKLLRGQNRQNFPPQTSWRRIKTKCATDHIIWALDLEETDFARRNFKIGDASIRRIRALLEERNLKLKHYLDCGAEGFLSWEPLHDLLAQSKAR